MRRACAKGRAVNLRRGCSLFALASCVLSNALGGCSSGPPPAHADRFVYGDQIEPDSLNPKLSTSLAARRVEALLFDGLLRYGRSGSLEPDLATVVPTRANGGISADGKTLTYHLNPRARWHDGVPVTAADVLYTWHAILDPANRVTTRVGYDEIARMTAPDPLTLRIQYRAPYAPAISLFTTNFGLILPEHALAAEDFNTGTFGRAPLGSGPYVFDRWNHGSSIELHANPYYFRGAPRIGRLLYRIVPDTTTIFNAIRTHEIDAAEVEANFVAPLRSVAGIAVAAAPELGYRHMEFNTSHPALHEPVVRLALSYAVDRAAVFDKIYFGLGDRAPGDVLPASGWGDPLLRPYPHDAVRAEAMLERAGWRRGSDGVRAKNGVRLDLSLAAVAGQRPAEATEVELQSDWAKIGVRTSIKNEPGAALFAATGPLARGTFDIAYFGWVDDPDPDDTNRFGSAKAPPIGLNYSRLADRTVDALQRRSLAAVQGAARHAIVARLEDRLVALDAADTIYWIPSLIAHTTSVRGIDPIPDGVVFWNVQDWRFIKP